MPLPLYIVHACLENFCIQLSKCSGHIRHNIETECAGTTAHTLAHAVDGSQTAYTFSRACGWLSFGEADQCAAHWVPFHANGEMETADDQAGIHSVQDIHKRAGFRGLMSCERDSSHATPIFQVSTRLLSRKSTCACQPCLHFTEMGSTQTCSCRYDAAVVEDVKQGLLSHTVGMRAATGERVVTFDQWAQLFHWIGSRLDIHDAEKLQKRMGAHIGCKELDECRAPLQVRISIPNRSVLHLAVESIRLLPCL